VRYGTILDNRHVYDVCRRKPRDLFLRVFDKSCGSVDGELLLVIEFRESDDADMFEEKYT